MSGTSTEVSRAVRAAAGAESRLDSLERAVEDIRGRGSMADVERIGGSPISSAMYARIQERIDSGVRSVEERMSARLHSVCDAATDVARRAAQDSKLGDRVAHLEMSVGSHQGV